MKKQIKIVCKCKYILLVCQNVDIIIIYIYIYMYMPESNLYVIVWVTYILFQNRVAPFEILIIR